MELVYIELHTISQNYPSRELSDGEIRYKLIPFMVRLDAIDAFNESAILVSGKWIDISEGRKGLQEKIHAALNPKQEQLPPIPTEPAVEGQPAE